MLASDLGRVRESLLDRTQYVRNQLSLLLAHVLCSENSRPNERMPKVPEQLLVIKVKVRMVMLMMMEVVIVVVDIIVVVVVVELVGVHLVVVVFSI